MKILSPKKKKKKKRAKRSKAKANGYFTSLHTSIHPVHTSITYHTLFFFFYISYSVRPGKRTSLSLTPTINNHQFTYMLESCKF